MTRPLVALALTGLLSASPGVAQGPIGRVEGRVTDPSGAGLAGVALALDGPAKRTGRSGADGRFVFEGLPPGAYRLAAERRGFTTVDRSVSVAPDATADGSVALTVSLGEQVVVTASRVETSVVDAPATVSVVDERAIETSTAQNVPDLLRAIPGVNVIQSSARDLNVASRQASPFLNGSQLTLVDGRPLYFDFFNVVLWDLLSVGTSDIEQVEVVRGPAATMWGANAVTGVVHVLTKPPRSSPGLSFTLSGGGFGTGDEGTGGVYGATARYAAAPSDRLSYRISAGYFHSDAFERPTGTIPVTSTPIEPGKTVGGGSYSDVRYANTGTGQPRVDIRVDQEVGEAGRLTYSAGLAGTSGIILTPIGPFDIESSSKLGYGRVAYTNGGFRASLFANVLSGKAPALISVDAQGQPLRIDFENGAYDADAGYTKLLGKRHLVSVGANFRYNTFDLSIAPDAPNRNQYGFYAQDEVDLDRFRLSLAARVDKFENLEKASFSPRAALAYTPVDGHTFKVSYNRAFRAPSAVENYLDISIIGGSIPLGSIDPRLEGQSFPVVTQNVGNPDLTAESLDAWEIGYAAQLGGTRFGLNLYRNDARDVIQTNPGGDALLAAGEQPYYTSANPPAGWPFPPQVIDLLAARGIYLPSLVKALNMGRVRNEGVEVSVSQVLGPATSGYVSYSYQATPELRDPVGDPARPTSDSIAVPPRHRLGVGLSYSGDLWLGGVSALYSDRAFWTQVLDPRYYGYSGSYLMLNASIGRRWADGRLVTSLKGTNLLNQGIQQHVFGDVLRRSIVAEAAFHF